MQTNSPTALPPVAALASLLECRDRAKEIARQQHNRLRDIRAYNTTRLFKEYRHD